jgi:hypothetical protein
MCKNTIEDFWKLVDVREPDECWEWQGGCVPFGYGHFRLDGKRWVTHALAFTLLSNPIPKGKCVLHKCDNPPCCNPKHLWLGTKRQNNKDRDKKKRTNPAKGERHWHAKLTDDNVREIRRLYWKEGWLQKDIAAKFGVVHQIISAIVNRTDWAHITD